MASDPNYLTKKLEQLMEARGISQNHLARISGVPQGTISKMLSGEHTQPTFQTMQKLAMALGVDVVEFADPGITINTIEARPPGRPRVISRKN